MVLTNLITSFMFKKKINQFLWKVFPNLDYKAFDNLTCSSTNYRSLACYPFVNKTTTLFSRHTEKHLSDYIDWKNLVLLMSSSSSSSLLVNINEPPCPVSHWAVYVNKLCRRTSTFASPNVKYSNPPRIILLETN